MNESILNDIKKLLGLTPEYTPYDTDIIIHINSVFMTLHQLGLGPEETFQITGAGQTWSDFCSNIKDFSAVRSYIYVKVKMIFDPSGSATINQMFADMAKEYEWRLNVEAESGGHNK